MGHFYALVCLLLFCYIFQTSTAALFCQEGGKVRPPSRNRTQVPGTELGEQPNKTTVLCCGFDKISSDTHTCCMGSRVGLDSPCCVSGNCECTPSSDWITQSRVDTLTRNETIKNLTDRLSVERGRLNAERSFYIEFINVLEELLNHNVAGGKDLKDMHDLVKCLKGKDVSGKNRKELEVLKGLLQSNRGNIGSIHEEFKGNSKDCWDDAHPPSLGFGFAPLESPPPRAKVQESIDNDIKTYKNTTDVTHHNYHQVYCILGPLKNDLKLSWYLIGLLDSELKKSGRVEKRSIENEMDAEGEGGSFGSISIIRNAARSRFARQAPDDCPVTKWTEHIETIKDKIAQADQLLKDVDAAKKYNQNLCEDYWIVNPMDVI